MGFDIYYTGRGVPVDFSYASIGNFGTDIVEDTARAGIIAASPYVNRHLFINNKEIGTLGSRRQGCELENGTYTIFFEDESHRRSDPVVFTVNNDRHEFRVDYYDGSRIPVSYTGTGTPVTVPARPVDDRLLDTAIRGGFSTISESLPASAKIAIINIVAPNREDSAFILEELTVLFVNSRKFTVVERQTLEAVTRERNFQLSGEVSDETSVSIGQFIGADIVITGTVSGDGERRRLRLRALDVKTAQVLAASSGRM